MKYEYTTINASTQTASAILTTLNQLGEQGWELVTTATVFTSKPGATGTGGSLTFYLKREKNA